MGELQELESHFLENPKAREAVLTQAVAEDGNYVVAEVERLIAKYVVLPGAAKLPVALWALATHVFDVFDAYPYLVLKSPHPECGKTRLFEVLDLVCHSPLQATAPSEAALFRLIESLKPTLFLDELEFLSLARSERAQAIIGILNVGYRRGGRVPRCIGEKGEKVKFFDVFGPKAFAAIGRVPRSIESRSIVVRIQRRTKNEPLTRFIYRQAQKNVESLKSLIPRALESVRTNIQEVYENIADLDFLERDRDAEIWIPLFCLCSVLAPGRISDLRECAKSLCEKKGNADNQETRSLRLLGDIQRVWDGQGERMFSSDLVRQLKDIDDGPWNGDKPLTQNNLARMLSQYEIYPRQGRIAKGNKKAYERKDFLEAWGRYLSQEEETTETVETTQHPCGSEPLSGSET